MHNRFYLSLLCLFCLLTPGALQAATLAPLPPLDAYVGAEKCGECHPAHHEAWTATYHRNAVRDAKAEPEAILGHFTGPIEGFTREDVEYVIGGHWYQRYMVKIGDDYYILPKIWSAASHRWDPVDTWSWKKKPYSKQCKGCHATRYDPDEKSLVEHQIGCEACHGPGALHARSGGRTPILDLARLDNDERDLICASCHVRGRDATGRYPFAVGYVPGRNLTDYYLPLATMEDETPRETFLRTFREWFSRLGSGHPPACDVCGIKKGNADKKELTTSEECRTCHAFKDETHTNLSHPGEIRLECLDCHQKFGRIVADAGDIHSPDTFRVHKAISYETNDSNGVCAKCH